jgi:hypothetical protein
VTSVLMAKQNQCRAIGIENHEEKTWLRSNDLICSAHTGVTHLSEESNAIHRLEGNRLPTVDKSNSSGEISGDTEAVVPGTVEVIDSSELAKRLHVPESWIRSRTNQRRTSDPIPHYRLGRYIRFSWGSKEIREWLNRQLVNKNRPPSRRRM